MPKRPRGCVCAHRSMVQTIKGPTLGSRPDREIHVVVLDVSFRARDLPRPADFLGGGVLDHRNDRTPAAAGAVSARRAPVFPDMRSVRAEVSKIWRDLWR